MSFPPTSELPVLRKVIRSSTIDLVAEEIRNAIYNGSLPPGQSINEVRTAELLGVSRPSLREALQRMVSEGVMSHAPGRGVWVKQMKSDDIADVYAVREAIEVQAVKMVIRLRRSTVAIEAGLADLERAIISNAARPIGDADLEFHHAIVASAGSIRLSSAMQVSMVHTRLLSLSDPRGYEVRCDLMGSHRGLTAAIAEGAEARALSILTGIMTESVARLCDPHLGPKTVVVKDDSEEAYADDQWSSLRDTMKS